ncbi:MAG: class II aldolase [Rhodospirillales bacterium]|nr:MAG: class II aldolase [Rhodospirillales bacterium]
MVAAAIAMNDQGLNQGTSGNLSVRLDDGGFLITPSGIPCDRLEPGDMVRMAADGACYRQPLAPSSEWRIHRDLLRERPEVGAVVHAHPTYATVLAIRGMAIPAVHYMIAAAGGSTIRCAPYATFGSQALSDHAVRALEGRLACLLANHGMIALGPSLERALWLAGEVEALARQYVLSLLLGGANVLPDDEIARVAALFADYGPKSKGS